MDVHGANVRSGHVVVITKQKRRTCSTRTSRVFFSDFFSKFFFSFHPDRHVQGNGGAAPRPLHRQQPRAAVDTRRLTGTRLRQTVYTHVVLARAGYVQTMSATAKDKTMPQRSPFAIQELLGLTDSNRSPAAAVSAVTPQYPQPAAPGPAGPSCFADRDARLHHHGHHGHHSHHSQMVASRFAYFNAQAAVAAAFLPHNMNSLAAAVGITAAAAANNNGGTPLSLASNHSAAAAAAAAAAAGKSRFYTVTLMYGSIYVIMGSTLIVYWPLRFLVYFVDVRQKPQSMIFTFEIYKKMLPLIS